MLRICDSNLQVRAFDVALKAEKIFSHKNLNRLDHGLKVGKLSLKVTSKGLQVVLGKGYGSSDIEIVVKTGHMQQHRVSRL